MKLRASRPQIHELEKRLRVVINCVNLWKVIAFQIDKYCTLCSIATLFKLTTKIHHQVRYVLIIILLTKTSFFFVPLWLLQCPLAVIQFMKLWASRKNSLSFDLLRGNVTADLVRAFVILEWDCVISRAKGFKPSLITKRAKINQFCG